MPSSVIRVCERSSRWSFGSRAMSIISTSSTQAPRRFTATTLPAASRCTFPPSPATQSVTSPACNIPPAVSSRKIPVFSIALGPSNPLFAAPQPVTGCVVVDNPALRQRGFQGFEAGLGYGGVVEVQEFQRANGLQVVDALIGHARMVQAELL